MSATPPHPEQDVSEKGEPRFAPTNNEAALQAQTQHSALSTQHSALLHVAFLYADLMNIYGDRGNTISIEQRCKWRGIGVSVERVSVGDPLDTDKYDLYFFGGGQDQQQEAVAADLQRDGRGARLRQAVEDGAALLSVCGGYQLLGHYYQPHNADKLPGISLFDAYSVAGPTRFIGNMVVDSEQFGRLVGFENHSAHTYLNKGLPPLGRVTVGHGNNGEDGWEGAIYKSAIGCYLHGSLLPKNPQVADWLIERALARRYGNVALPPLDDTIEAQAHDSAIERAKATH